MNNLIAADIQIAPQGGFVGFGRLGTNVGNGIGIFSTFISTTIGILTIVAIVWFVITLITGAIGIISAGSDKNALEGARKKIITGLIGLVVTIAGISLTSLLGKLLGFENILDIQKMFCSITTCSP